MESKFFTQRSQDPALSEVALVGVVEAEGVEDWEKFWERIGTLRSSFFAISRRVVRLISVFSTF